MRISKFIIVIIIPLTGLMGCTEHQEYQFSEKPNIVIILADDMGFSDPGCYGSEINTPNLDRLAAEGIRFTQLHNTAKCFPSRACLLTGLYAQQCNMDVINDSLRNSITLGEVLKNAGYRTFMVGKHHGLDNPYYRGFDRYFGLRDGCCNYFNPGVMREGEPEPAHKTWAKPRKWCIDENLYAPYTPDEKDFYTTDYFTKYALEYLETYKNEDKPFFLYAAYTAPHDPLHAWPGDIEKYLGRYMEGYEVIRDRRYEKQKEMGLVDASFPLSESTCENWADLTLEEKLTADSLMAVYTAMIDRMDQNIGRIIDKIKELGEYENTLFMFMSDNGCQPQGPGDESINDTGRDYPIGSIGRWASLNQSWANVGNTPFRYYKEWSHEGGTCSPFIMCWPAKRSEFHIRFSDFPSHFIDIMPTLLEITGSDYPDFFNGEKIYPYQGVSLLPVWKGEKIMREKPIFWQWNKGKAVRKDNFKLVSGNNGPWELYNMETDKTESINLVDEEQAVVDELEMLYEEWISEVKGIE
jgi:arylsulfatase